ncbi:MAG: hypothetical protein IKS75_09665 [Clostridiales bacterium]|nr:hypothetical protein [Clostridiales bacterium]
MRLRSISVLLAVAMTAVCFAGCKDNSAGAVGAGEANTRMVADAAIAYGMKEKDFNDVYDLMVEYDNVGSAYYVSKNASDAQGCFLQLMSIGKNYVGSITEVTVAAANETLGTGNFTSCAYQFIFADNDSAKQFYDTVAMYYKDIGGEVASGEQDGFTYTLNYFEGSVAVDKEGLYLKDNMVIYVCAYTTIESRNTGFASVVFKDVGVIDPEVLKHA